MGFINQLTTGGPHIVDIVGKYPMNIPESGEFVGYMYGKFMGYLW